MTRGTHLWCWIAVLGAVAAEQSLAAEPQASGTPVLSGCEYDYAPFCLVREGSQADGFSVALLRATLKVMGREVTFKTAPWAELKQDLTEGRLQALPMVARSPEREQIFDFTFPYYTMHGTIVVRDDNTTIHGSTDLKGKRVAVLQEDIAHEYLRKTNLGAIIVPRPTFAAAMLELSEGKHDAVVIQKLLALQLIKDSGLTNLITVGSSLSGYQQVFCFAVKKGDTELLRLLNEGLSIVMAGGTFRRLQAEWFSALEAAGRTKSRIIVGGDANYPPFEFLNANGQPAGYCVDLTRAIAKQMGLSVNIRLGPWNRVRAGMDRNEIDVLQGMYYSAERDNRFDFSPPHTLIQQVIAVRKGSAPLARMQELAGKTILAQEGDVLHDLARQYGYEKKLVLLDNQQEALRRLAAGEGDCALVARVPALYWIEKNRWQNLVIGSQPLLSAEYCYATPSGHEPLLAEFAEGLAAVKKSGEYRAIQAKWLGVYDQPAVSIRTVVKYVAFSALPLLALLAGSLLWMRSLKVQVRQRTQELQIETEFLHRIHQAGTTRDVVSTAVEFLRKLSGCDAVGVRLKDGDDYPYYLAQGFPPEFIQTENQLGAREEHGTLRCDQNDQALADCLCGKVILGRFEPNQPYFTKGGAFWTNSNTQPQADSAAPDRQVCPRGRCHASGYESVALVPLYVGAQRLGLIQFNHRRPGAFSARSIALWERLADALAIAVTTARAEESLRQSETTNRALLTAVPDLLFRVRSDGTLFGFTGRTESLYVAPERFLGKKLHDVLPAQVADSLMACMQDAIARGQMATCEYSLDIRGECRWFEARVVVSGTNELLQVIRDITDRQRAEEALRESEAMFRAIGELNPFGVWECDPDGGMVYMSQLWLDMAGMTLDQCRQFGWMNRYAPGEGEEMLKAWRQCCATGSHWEYEYHVLDKDSAERWVLSRGFPLRDANGQITKWVGLNIDISERKRTEQELQAAKDSAEQANRAKDHFLAVLSHELRTPLTPVVMGLSVLQDRTDISGEMRETLEMIHRNVKMEARLIDDLLDVTRIARGKVELNRSTVQLCAVIQRAVEVCKPDIEARRLNFEMDFGPSAPYWVEADESRLQQVFWNLLKNAIKFTSRDGCLSIRCRSSEEHVVVEVNDTGIGIEPQALSRIFNVFEQAELSITRQFGGLGLGLAISKALVELHGGTISAHSEGLAKGATFRIRLPLCTPAGRLTAPPSLAEPQRVARPLRILLVEDHGVTAQMMRMVLCSEGHTVETAGDVNTALELASQREFDLLLSDLGLPDGSGHDLMRELRARGHKFPGIALSGYGQEADISRSSQAGFATHLTKPASRESLIAAVAATTAGK